MLERIIIVSAGFLLDLLFGDPYWLWHPIRGIGTLIERTLKLLCRLGKLRGEREADRAKKRTAGCVLVFIVTVISTGVPALLLYGAWLIHPWLKTAVSILLCYQMLAMKCLKTESMKVYEALKRQDTKKARTAVSMIVGRDTDRLDAEGITKAAVETVAENTSDGVIAPLLFMLLFGPLGAVFYKAVNTMDSMVGYKNDTYCYLGTAAAKLDDLLNFIPARISALGMTAAAFFLRMDVKNAWKIYRRDRYQHASPNSAQTEAVCAGALRVRLAGDAWYFGTLCRKPSIGDPIRKVEAFDIVRANRLLYGTSFIILTAGLAALFAVWLL